MRRTRRTFTSEYKLEAVALLSSGGRSLSSVARDLDLDPKLFRRWREELKQEGAGAFPGKGHLRPEEAELKRLHGEIERLREDREILKKSVGDLLGAPARVKYSFMKKYQEEFRVTAMCRVVEASRSGYYLWLKGLESQRVREDRKLRVEIRAVYRRSRGRYGSPRVHRAFQQQGVGCGKNRVARLMKEEKLQARRDRRFKVTTRSVSGRRVASTRLNQEFSVAHLDTVWAGDITYLWTREGWLYLAVLLDLCSRRVVGWSCSETHLWWSRPWRRRFGNGGRHRGCCTTAIRVGSTPASITKRPWRPRGCR